MQCGEIIPLTCTCNEMLEKICLVYWIDKYCSLSERKPTVYYIFSNFEMLIS